MKKRFPSRPTAFVAIGLLSALFAVWFFMRDDGKTEPQRPEPMMQEPIKYDKDSVKVTNRKVKYESTGNQQPVDASRWNDTTRHLPHR